MSRPVKLEPTPKNSFLAEKECPYDDKESPYYDDKESPFDDKESPFDDKESPFDNKEPPSHQASHKYKYVPAVLVGGQKELEGTVESFRGNKGEILFHYSSKKFVVPFFASSGSQVHIGQGFFFFFF